MGKAKGTTFKNCQVINRATSRRQDLRTLYCELSGELQLQYFQSILFSRMRTYLTWIGLLTCFFSYASATALTYKLIANEKACFFSNVEQQGAKIAFYFAVSPYVFCSQSNCYMMLSVQLKPQPSLRSNLAVPSMSTTPSRAPMGRSSWKTQRSGSWIRSSLLRRLGNTAFASTMR